MTLPIDVLALLLASSIASAPAIAQQPPPSGADIQAAFRDYKTVAEDLDPVTYTDDADSRALLADAKKELLDDHRRLEASIVAANENPPALKSAFLILDALHQYRTSLWLFEDQVIGARGNVDINKRGRFVAIIESHSETLTWFIHLNRTSVLRLIGECGTANHDRE